MVCRSMLASDSGEMDSALFLLSLGVSRGLEKRDTGHRRNRCYPSLHCYFNGRRQKKSTTCVCVMSCSTKNLSVATVMAQIRKLRCKFH